MLPDVNCTLSASGAGRLDVVSVVVAVVVEGVIVFTFPDLRFSPLVDVVDVVVVIVDAVVVALPCTDDNEHNLTR